MKKSIIILIMICWSSITKAQTGICPPTASLCNQTVTADVASSSQQSSTVTPSFANAVNDTFPQYSFCLGDPILLNGYWNPSVSVTGANWQQIDASCTGITLPLGISSLSTTSVTWPSGHSVSTSNQVLPVTISTPGLYVFMFTGNIEGCTSPYDLVYVRIFPVPVANAGPSFIACNHSTLAGYAYMQTLNAVPANTAAGEEGTWEWYPASAYHIPLVDIHSPNATIHSIPNVYGSLAWNNVFRWRVTNTITGCSSVDTLRIIIPHEGAVFASDNDTICSNSVQRASSSCGGTPGVNNTCISNPGVASVYWNPFDPLDPNNTPGYTILNPPAAYFWWDYVANSYAPLSGGSPSALPFGVVPSIDNLWGEVMRFTAAPTGNPSPFSFYTGSYTFQYHVRGLCVSGDDEVTFTFLSSIGITPVAYLGNRTLCDTLQTFTGTLPDTGEYVQWFFDTTIAVVSGFEGNTFTNPWVSGSNTLVLDFPNVTGTYQIIYRIYGADTASGCYTQGIYYIYPDINPAPIPWNATTNAPIPPVSTSPYQVEITLPCGQESVLLPYQVINLLTNLYIPSGTTNVTSTLNYTGFTGTGTLLTTPLMSGNLLSGLTLPGTYHVTITSIGGCSHTNSAYIDIIVQMPGDGASAGSPVFLNCGENSVGLAANIPVVGSGIWSLVGWPTMPSPDIVTNYISIGSLGNNYATVTNLNDIGLYTFVWSVSNPSCDSTEYHDTLNIIVADTSLTSTYAGADTSYCNGDSISLYATGEYGYWTATDTTLSFVNATNPNTVVLGLPTAVTTQQSYAFVWHLLGGCYDITDTVIVTLDPGLCCLASSDPAYIHLPNNFVYDQNTILTGKYFIEGIVTVTNHAILDITNVDMVFAECAGIDFDEGTLVRANNSVFRPCNIQESWRGLSFADSTLGIIEQCVFKNAHRAIDMPSGNYTIRIYNNTFANNHIAIYTNSARLNEAITGNNFSIDNSFVNFYKGDCAETDTFDLSFFDQPGFIANYGIVGNKSNYLGLISQNNFINGCDPADNHLFYGISGLSMYAIIGNNTFTNLFRAINLGGANGTQIFNNKIDVAVTGKDETSFRYITQIRLTQSQNCHINNNILTSSLKFSNFAERFSILDFGGLIYCEDNLYTEIADNVTTGGINIISLFNSPYTFVKNNLLKEASYSGIHAKNSLPVDITCNEIFMDSENLDYRFGIVIDDSDIDRQNSQSLIRNNCVFDASTAISINSGSCEYKIPVIYNNFLYNYSYTGIHVDGSGSIGTSTYPGRNTFISNNSGNGAVDIEGNILCIVTVAGNYGLNSRDGGITVINAYPFNSSASCAHQITEYSHFNYNQQLAMDSLTICAPFTFYQDSLIIMETGKIGLVKGFERHINIMDNAEMLQQTAGLFNLLAIDDKQDEILVVYNFVNSLGKLTANQNIWLNYFFNFAKRDFQKALADLQSIRCNNEMEQQTLILETIKTKMLLENIQPRELDATNIANLKSIAAQELSYSPQAYDLLKLASDGYDYPFQTIVLKTQKHSKNIISLNENALKVYPNPASNNLILELVDATDGKATITIFDALGQSVNQVQTNIKAGKLSIDISSLANGLYHVQMINASNQSLSNSFVKQ